MRINGLYRWLGGFFLVLAVIIVGGCGAGNSGTADVAPAPSATPTSSVASLYLSAAPATVTSDNTTSTTVTVTALSSGNAVVSGAVATLSADSGIMSSASVTTDATGKATFTFSSGEFDKRSRTATITATAGTASAVLPVQITGSSITISANPTIITVGQTSTVTVTAKDSSAATAAPVSGATITLTKSAGTGTVTSSAASAPTASDGTAVFTITGTGAGPVTLLASGLGATASLDMSVGAAAGSGVFRVTQVVTGGVTTVDPTAVGMTASTMTVTVAAPTSTATQRTVRFATSMGTWGNGLSVQDVTAAAGIATATLSKPATSGVALVQVVDADPSSTDSDSFTVGMTASTPASIDVQATPTVVQKSVGTTTGTSEVIATVRDANGNPVGGQLVVFSLLNTTGGGETLSSIMAVSSSVPADGLALGQVRTSFIAGSLSSAQTGVTVRASVPGTSLFDDVGIVIGGTAGSIAFGEALVMSETANATSYKHPRVVMVSDSNGNPVAGAEVTLSLWPTGYYTGTGCVTTGFSPNEDTNENLVLDALEDTNADGVLWPINSAAGSVPAKVVTDASGLATFDHIFTKSNAIWTHVRLRAKTLVQGSETLSMVTYQLSVLKADVEPTCRLPNSPYGP